MDQSLLWIFIHLPKSGGTTIKGHLYHHLEWDETFIECSNWGKTFRKENGRLPLEKRPLEARQKVAALAGHRAYYGIHELVPGKEPRYFTVLRDPAERCVSWFNFKRSRGEIQDDFLSYYEQVYNRRYVNFMVQYYAARFFGRFGSPEIADTSQQLILARKGLERCWYVGLTDTLNDDLPGLFDQMGLPTTWQNYRVAGWEKNGLAGLDSHPKAEKGEILTPYFRLDEATRQRIYADHPLDVDLYRYALELNKSSNPLKHPVPEKVNGPQLEQSNGKR